MSRRRVGWVGVLALAVLAAACGDDGGSTEASAPSTTVAPTTEAEVVDEPYEGATSELYTDDAVWLCRPDLTNDACDEDLTATVVEPDGSFTEAPFEPAADPGVDCFYVYPTIDYAQAAGNHPFEVPNPLEAITVRGQAARFGSVCDVYAPRYRQATIGSYRQVRADGLYGVEAFEVAYQDVLDAFRHYMATWNDGRPIVLLGHSQGSHHLIRLVEEEFDPSPALRAQLVSALLIGPTGRLRVPEDEVVGGSFDNIPLCTEADQAGCVVAFDSYAEQLPPDPRVVLDDGMQAPCVNPAELVDGDDRLTAGYFGTTQPGVPTPTEVIEDYYTATCAETDDGVDYLAIAEDPAPGDTRDLEHIDSRLAVDDSLHVLDINFTLGDLLALVVRQTEALGGG